MAERFFVADIPAWLFAFVQREKFLDMDREVVVRLVDLAIRQAPPFSAFGATSSSFCATLYAVYGVRANLSHEEAVLMEGLLECWSQGFVSIAGWDMPHGIWDHFKGGVYESDRVEMDADTGNPRVSYRSLIYGGAHSRRAEQWNEVVQWPDGKWRSRFVLRGPPGSLEPLYKVPSPV